MNSATNSRNRLLAGLAGLVVGLAPAALGQSQTTLNELSKLCDRLAQPDQTVAERDARQALDMLAEWKLTADGLSGEDRIRFLLVELYAALAQGDASTAIERAKLLLSENSENPVVLDAAYLAAFAGGDAQLGMDALKKLSRSAKGDKRSLLSVRRRQMRGVGEKASDVTIRAEDMTEFEADRRGERLLLIDFWNLATPPEKDVVAALCKLHAEYENSLHFEMVGVNSDDENGVAAAREFVETNGYVWPQRYERQAIKAPITQEAFHVGEPPWQVLIDTFGYVRAIGDIREPVFQYAIRAAISETRGDRDIVMVRSRDGKQPEKPGDKIKAPVKPKPKVESEEKPSDPEAERLLRLARTYMKTGKKTDAKRLFEQIVREYPGTPEARDAQERLDNDFP